MTHQTMKGQSLIEVVIALALFAMGSAALFSLLMGQTTIVHTVERNNRALASAEEGLEAVRAIRNSNWFTLANGTYGLARSGASWALAGTPDTTDGITRSITVASLNDTTKNVTVNASWSTGAGRTRTVTLETRLRDWRAIGSENRLSGDWTNPISLGTVDLGPGIQANGIAVKNHIVYIAGSASASAKPDFFVIDATNGESPRVLGSINTGPGLNDVAVAGSYAYVANRDDDNNQLQVINVANPASPQLVISITPPNVGSDAEAYSVDAVGSFVYLGLDRSSGREFHIYDMTDPANPVWRGAYEVNGDVKKIVVGGSYAYLGLEIDDRELLILDISNPTAPAFIGRFDAAGGSENATTIDVHDGSGVTYLGRTVGGNHTDHHEFYIVNTSNPGSPAALGSFDIPHTINALTTVDYLSFLATTDSNNEFKVYRVDNPQNIGLWSQFNFPQAASDIAYERNTIYVAVRSNDALRIITSSP